MVWIDSHCHLDSLEGDLAPYLARAHEAGVEQMVTIGTDLDSSRRAVELASEHPEVWAVVGIHPTEATGFSSETAEVIEALGAHERVVAIGEIGLDYYWDYSTPEDQDRAFRSQIDIAKRLGKPVVLHIREAMDQVLALIEEVEPPPGGLVFHCFSGTAEQADKALALGGQISFAGNVTYKNAEPLREAARRVPLDHLLVETDSPYLAPVPMRGKKNEPAYLVHTGTALAKALDRPVEELAEATTANARRVFRLA